MVTRWPLPFDRFNQYTGEIEDLVQLTYQGTARVQMMPGLFEALYEGRPMTEEKQEQRDAARAVAELAESEARREFPLLHGHSAIALWGAIEVLVQDLAVAWLLDYPEALTAKPLGDIKLSVAEMLTLDDEARAKHLVSEAQKVLKADLKTGVGQFEPVLEAVGLKGSNDRRVADGIFYLQQYRNLLAHQAGWADDRFVRTCPTLGYESGERVFISGALFRHFMHCALIYAYGVRQRCAAASDTEMPVVETLDEMLDFEWGSVRLEVTSPADKSSEERKVSE